MVSFACNGLAIPRHQSMKVLQIATLNCVSLIAQRRKQWVLNLLLQKNVDVAMLQETKLGTEQQVESLAYFMRRHFECFSSKANARSGGSSVLIRKGRGIEICPERETDHNGRISAVEFLYRDELHKLISVYAPNDIAERKEFLSLSVHTLTRHAKRYWRATLTASCTRQTAQGGCGRM